MGEIRPYICTKDARAAIDWYVDAMGATVTYEPIVMDDGRIGHVELSFDGATVMMSDPYPEIHVEAPAEGRGAAVTLYLTTDDVDTVTQRAVERGAILDRGPEDSDHGRTAVFRDPFGHRWMLGQSDG
ncbi:MAG TPA: VOC family protein [Lapillicoccus sp.]|nr:VOC family protein [Lapillicoccus sp.]